MNKISSDRAQMLLKKASVSIRGLHEENQTLREKVSGLEKTARVNDLAKTMEDKGLLSELDLTEKIAHLNDANLDVAEEAVKMAAPQTNLFGGLSDEPSVSSSPFENYIMTGESY